MQTSQVSRNFSESPEMVHDLQVSRQCYKMSGNVENLIDLLFFCNKNAVGVNPTDDDHMDLKLAPDDARMTIASGLRLHKHAYY